nr:reverse transcriptase domain-containing protein [Tanacetum cinerariifolium]
MQTCSSSRLVSNPSSNLTPSTNPNLKGRNRRRSKQRIEDFNLEEHSPPIVTMADQRTMAQLLQAPTEGYEDAIVVPAITVDNFELKHGLFTLVQNKQFFGHDKEDPHAHGAARIWLEKEPPLSIFTWDDLVLKFINQFFPPSKTTNLRNEITNFQEHFDESFSEAWDRFKDLLRACPYHGFSELHQLDIINNALNSKDQDSLNSTAGGIFLDKMPRECLAIIESKSKVRYSHNKPIVAKVVQSESPVLTSEPVTSLISEPAVALVVQSESPVLTSEPVTSLISEPAVALKLPEKLGDPCKFLIPCDFPSMAECLALADLGASINLMPFSVWKIRSLLDFKPTCMTLELADRSISHPVEVTEDVYVKVGSFHFDADPRVPLILERSFLKTGRALIDVFEGELTLRFGKEAITFNLDQTLRFSANYSDMTEKRIDVMTWPYYDLIVSTSSPTLTSFRNSDFLLEEVNAFLAIEDDPTSPEFYQPYLDPGGDILLLEAFLNDDPSKPPPNQGNYLPEVRKELKICEAKSDKSLVDEPLEVELKYLPPHLEYAFLEGDDKLLVIIAKDLSVEEKTALITILKSHKRAIAWKHYDIKGIDPEFYTHKILMEEDFKPAV